MIPFGMDCNPGEKATLPARSGSSLAATQDTLQQLLAFF
jgi:hypothetical protein